MQNFKKSIFIIVIFLLSIFSIERGFSQETIPLPEHPRPDFERSLWQNLNGNWDFEFDKNDAGITNKWFLGQKKFTKTISVPFPWGSPLSGVKNEADIACIRKKLRQKMSGKTKKFS